MHSGEWVQQMAGAPWAQKVLTLCGKVWLRWAQLAPDTLLGRASAGIAVGTVRTWPQYTERCTHPGASRVETGEAGAPGDSSSS